MTATNQSLQPDVTFHTTIISVLNITESYEMSTFSRHFVDAFTLLGLCVPPRVVLDPCSFGGIGLTETSVNNWQRSLRNLL